MKIVIEVNDIPKNDHERWALSHGTPLPKNHGRLIDAMALKDEWVDIFESAYGDECALRFKHSIEYMPTIIEADKGIRNESDNHS